jgi:chromate transporter
VRSDAEIEAGSNGPDNVGGVSLRELFRVFGTIGITSFGGGLSGWMFREIVERRQWLSTQEFLTGLSLARTMPGTNVVNLSIWIGYRLRRGVGALMATCGVLAGPLVLIIVVALLYRRWGRSVEVHQILFGITAAALGLSLSMGLKSLAAVATKPFYTIVVLLAFVGVGILHWPMLPIVAVLAPASVAWAFFVDKPDEG